MVQVGEMHVLYDVMEKYIRRSCDYVCDNFSIVMRTGLAERIILH